MLQWTCLLFAVPSGLGMYLSFPWTAVGCAVLAVTSTAYYRTGHVVPQAIDTIYTSAFTLASTAVGVVNVICHRCVFNALGVACSIVAMAIYFTKSKRRCACVDDAWHALVHVVGAIGLALMAFGPPIAPLVRPKHH